MARRSSAIASADGGRSAGRLAIARRMTRSTAATAGEPVSAGGCSYSVACRTSTMVRPLKAGRPASISKRIAPAAKRSLRASTLPPVTCSGAMYRGVPITMPVRVSPAAGREPLVELRPRQAEVEQLHAVNGQEHVGRLQVAMDDAAGVQRRERGQHAQTDRHRFRCAQRSAPQPLGQRFAFEQLHRDEQAAAVFADFVDLADVRVVDARRGPGLAPQALPRRLVVGAATTASSARSCGRGDRRAPHRRRPCRLHPACVRSHSDRCEPAGFLLRAPESRRGRVGR